MQRQRQRCTETATTNGNGETATEWWKPGISLIAVHHNFNIHNHQVSQFLSI